MLTLHNVKTNPNLCFQDFDIPKFVESRQVKHRNKGVKAKENTPAGHMHHEEF